MPAETRVNRHEEAPAPRRAAVLLGLALVAALAWLALSGDPVRSGAQRRGPEVALQLASRIGWESLLPVEGDLRADFPEPMYWHHGRSLCFGFSRVDFGPEDRRPSLARCVPDSFATELEPHEITVVSSTQSGSDTWHLVAAPHPVHSFAIETDAGPAIALSRVYLAASFAALRLPNDVSLATVTWTTAAGRFRCFPSPEASRTGVFCAG